VVSDIYYSCELATAVTVRPAGIFTAEFDALVSSVNTVFLAAYGKTAAVEVFDVEVKSVVKIFGASPNGST
jgi:hypothetical protein